MIMKKLMSMFLALVLVLSLGACGKSDSPAETTAGAQTEAVTQASTEEFTWTRTGYFKDDEDNLVTITASEDPENPGWYVGVMAGDIMSGWYIQQEGNTLHGDIASPDEEDAQPYVVTVSEEGEDGIKLESESGDVYHLTAYEMPEAAFTVTVNIERDGQIAYAQGEAEPEFDDEFPSQTAYIGLEKAEVYTFAAKPDEGYKFMKWTNYGEDYSTEPIITVEVTENMELVAVFGIKGTDETHVDLDKVKTMGELLGLPNYGTAAVDTKLVYAFEQDGMFYNAVAEMPKDLSEAFFELDSFADDYQEQLVKLVSSLKVEKITNLSENEPTQEFMDALIGKTGKELFDDGWYNSGWNLDDMEFYMSRGAYGFVMTMEGDVKNPENFEEEDINNLVVKEVKYTGISDYTYLEDGE